MIFTKKFGLTISLSLIGSPVLAQNTSATPPGATSAEVGTQLQKGTAQTDKKAINSAAEQQVNAKQSPSTRSDFLSILHAVNESEIKLGNLAMARSNKPAVKEYGQMLVKEHTESDRLLTNLAQSQNTRLESGLAEEKAKHMAQQYQELDTAKAGAFDQKFAKFMVQGHQEALDLVKQAKAAETEAAVIQFYDQLTPHLEAHLRQAKALQNAAAD